MSDTQTGSFDITIGKESKFFLFSGENYYPFGGADDLKGVYDTLEEAKKAFLKIKYYDWAHIMDIEGEIVWNTHGKIQS